MAAAHCYKRVIFQLTYRLFIPFRHSTRLPTRAATRRRGQSDLVSPHVQACTTFRRPKTWRELLHDPTHVALANGLLDP